MRRGSSQSGKEDNGYAALACLRRCPGENWQFGLSSQCDLGEPGAGASTDSPWGLWGEQLRLLGTDKVGAKVLAVQSEWNLLTESEEKGRLHRNCRGLGDIVWERWGSQLGPLGAALRTVGGSCTGCGEAAPG